MEILGNLVGLIRGNLLCFIWGIDHEFLIRIFSGVHFNINRRSKVQFGHGVLIGRNTSITVRERAILKMGEMASLNADCKIACQEKIIIGKNTIFGPNVMIYDHDHVFDSAGVKRNDFIKRSILIGDNCWIGAGTIILKGTTIGNNCIIGAGSVIKGVIPDGTLYIQKKQSEITRIGSDEAKE